MLCSLLLKAALSLHGEENTPQLFDLSFMQEAKGDYAGALTSMAGIIEKMPENYIAVLRCGWLNYCKGSNDEAVGYYIKAIKLAPGAIEPRLGIMLPLMALKAWRSVETYAHDVLSMTPDNYAALSRLAFVFYTQGKYGKALKLYLHLAKLYPSDVDMKLGVALTYLKMGNKSDAARLFREIVLIYPQNIKANEGLNEALKQR